MDDSSVSLYDLLGVSKHATDAEIEESYNNLAKEFHPEDAVDKLKEITFAYEVLSDPEKRIIYDRFGIKGLQDGDSDLASGGSDSESLFSRFFSPTSNDDIQIPLSVTLEELYNRVETKTVTYKRWEICTDCDAVGGDPTKEESCSQCVGFGLRTSMGLLVSGRCDACNGRGKIIKEEFQCKTCGGKGFKETENTVSVKIEPGMHHMEQIPFRSEGHQNKAGDRGHLVVVIQQEPHSVFQRKLSDLYISQVEIPLIQALCGLEYTFKHLDGRNLVVRTQPGHVIKPNAMMVVKGEGMPKPNNPLEKGDLLISFTVRMPENGFANAETMNKLEEILPSRTPFTMPTGEDVEEVQLVEIQPSEDYEASDEDAGVAQCAFS